MILNGIITLPTGNNLENKFKAIEEGIGVELDQLKLIQFAALFNIVGFNSSQIKPKDLEKLSAELKRLEKELSIEYILRSDKPKETPGIPIQPEQYFEDSNSFIESVLAQAKDTELPQSLPPDQLFFEYCKSHAKLPTGSYMQDPTTKIRVVPEDCIQINYKGYDKVVKKIDLSESPKDPLNSFFLAQIMGNSLGPSASEGNFSPERFYMAARSGLTAIEKRNDLRQPVLQTQKDALRIIASRNRMQSVQKVWEHLREFVTHSLKFMERDGK